MVPPTPEPGRISTHAPTASSEAAIETSVPTCLLAEDPVGSVPASTADPATSSGGGGGGGGSNVGPSPSNDGQARSGAATARLGPGAVVGIAAAVLAAALVTALVVAKKKGRSARSRERRRAAMAGRSSALHLDGAESDEEEHYSSSSSSSAADQANGPIPAGAPVAPKPLPPPPAEADTTPDFIPSSSILPSRSIAAPDDEVVATREAY